MTHPWMPKNPFVSIWRNAANRVAGVLRGRAAALVVRQVNNEASKKAVELAEPWTPAREARRKR